MTSELAPRNDEMVLETRYGTPDGISFRNQLFVNVEPARLAELRRKWNDLPVVPTEVDEDLATLPEGAGDWPRFLTWLRKEHQVEVKPVVHATLGMDHPDELTKTHIHARHENEETAAARNAFVVITNEGV